jgi:hypothetical protein
VAGRHAESVCKESIRFNKVAPRSKKFCVNGPNEIRGAEIREIVRRFVETPLRETCPVRPVTEKDTILKSLKETH